MKENKFYIFICPRLERRSHTHAFLELAYVLKGSAIHNRNQTETVIREGDYFVIDYDSQHSYSATTESFQLINCLFMPELIDSALKNCRSFRSVVSNYQIHFSDALLTCNPSATTFHDEDGSVKSLLLSMLEEFEKQSPGWLQIIRASIISLLVVTMRKICMNPSLDMPENDIEHLIRYINTEYASDITLKELCKKYNYAFTYISYKFKKTMGMTYMEYLQKIRVEQSMRLLIHTDKSVSEISQAVGYHDIKSFYAVFKRISGTTPAKFRQSYTDSQ